MTGATLSPEAILKDLAATWTDLGREGPGVLRACSMTLVAIRDEGEDLSAMLETLAALMPEHPARTIVIRLGPNEPLAARVRAQCWMPFGQRRQICAERIEITAAEDSLEDVASVISPLTAPDLPVMLWCRSQRVAENPAFGRLTAMAGKVVLDSAGWTDAKTAIRHMGTMAASHGVRVADLSWTRLTRWREMLSQVFENRRYAARLPEISRVRVVYGAGSEVAARYMGAWVVNALEAAGVSVELSLESDAGAPAGHLSAVALSGAGFRVELTRQDQRLVIRVDTLSRCTSFPHATDCQLLREELAIFREDPVFERTLASAARL
jgi:glucose-6-phosphate dehydrogenase assembly protein OpcA